MRKRTIWLAIAGVFLVALALLAACQLIPNRREAAPVPTITPLRIILTETDTPTFTLTPRPPTQTAAILPTNTPAPLKPPTAAPTFTPTASPMPFQLQVGTQRYIPAFTRPAQGCAWSGIAGQVFDSTGSGVPNVIIVITGKVDGKPVDQVGSTVQQGDYGPGGYEITLADHLPVSDESLFIQLFDSQGRVLTDATPFHMPDSCDRNLVLMNFQALYVFQQNFLPLVGRSE